MSRFLATLLPGCLLAIYLTFFVLQESLPPHSKQYLSPSLPSPVLKAFSGGFLRQFIAEILFIKTAVFWGGKKPGTIAQSDLDAFASNYYAMAQLHPKLLDIYYRSESTLAWEGKKYARYANQILDIGKKNLPSEVVIPFFQGFNYFKHLNSPALAATALREAGQITGAPQWLNHLAGVLMAESGNIKGGLLLLKTMQASIDNQQEKNRYQKDITAYEKALRIQHALERFYQDRRNYPVTIQELQPDYLDVLPSLGGGYAIKYKKPNLFIQRTKQNK